jgi:hypothetical protein
MSATSAVRSPTNPPRSDPTTAGQVTHYRRRAIGVLIATMLIWVPVIFGVWAAENSANQLLRHGLRTTGTVTGLDYGAKGSEWAEITYTVGDTSYVSSVPTSAYRRGEPVTVIYSPSDPSNMRTPSAAPQDQLVVVLLSFMALPMLGFAAWTARTSWYTVRLRRTLRRANSWQEWHYHALAAGRTRAVLLQTTERDRQAELTAEIADLGYQGEFRLAPQGTFTIAGDPSRFAIIWDPKAWRPVTLHKVKGRHQNAVANALATLSHPKAEAT